MWSTKFNISQYIALFSHFLFDKRIDFFSFSNILFVSFEFTNWVILLPVKWYSFQTLVHTLNILTDGRSRKNWEGWE